MARTNASLRAEVTDRQRLGGAITRAARSEHIPTEHDLKQAREDSLLQLRIGRSANYYAIVLLGLLFVGGFLIVVFNPYASSLPMFGSLYFLLFPIAGALILSFFGLAAKWETYQIWPWEAHFWVTILAVPSALWFSYLFLAHLDQYGPTAHWPLLPWMVPGALFAISVPVIGLVLTWQEWSGRKSGAFLAALLPIPLGLSLYVPGAGGNPAALTLVLVTSGGLYLLSGSLLHLISSGTQAHEREVIVSGQSRLYRSFDELRVREDALRDREATLLRREADVEVAEASAVRKIASVEDLRARLSQLEKDLEGRADLVHQHLQEASSKIAESSAIQRELSDRESQLLLREQEAGRWESQRQGREDALSKGEGELVRRQMELGNQEKELLDRQAALPAAESRLQARRQDLDRREAELRRRESGIQPAAAGAVAGGTPPSDLADRETRLAQLEKVLAEQNVALSSKARDSEARLEEVRSRLTEQAKREEALVARELALGAHEAEATRRQGEAAERQKQYAEALERVEQRARAIEQLQGGIVSQADDLTRRTSALELREAAVAQLKAELDQNRAEIERTQREIAQQQKALAATPVPPSPGAPAPSTVPSVGVPGARTTAPRVRRGAISTGVARLDELLGGGLGDRSQLLLIGPPFIGKEVVAYSFLSEGLRQGDTAIVVTTERSPPEIAQEIALVYPQFRDAERQGRVQWIDASNPSASPHLDASGRAGASVVKGPGDFTGILSGLAAATSPKPAPTPGRRYRVAVLNLSSCVRQGDPKAAYGFVHNLVSILKQKQAVALYGVEPGTLDDAQVQSTLARMDGAIQFKADRGKTLLSIQGAGDVATRDWIEYRSTNSALNLGSFTLERIR